MTSKNQVGKTLKHSSIYGIGSLISRLTSLVMLPIYTRFLTPEDYGVIELLVMAVEIASILIGLRITQAMMRFYLLEDQEERKKLVVSTVMILVVLTGSLGVGVLLLFSEQLTQFIFGGRDYISEFQLFAVTLLFRAISTAGFTYLRALQEPVKFVSISVLNLMMQVALNVYFVVYLELHVTGVVYSVLISGGIVAFGFLYYTIRRTGVGLSLSIAKELMGFVFPLILASIGAFYASYSDKYFLRVFSGLTEVGLYSLAARTVSVMGSVFEAFNMSWAADQYEVVKREDAKKVFKQIFRLLSLAMILSGTLIAIFVDDLFHVMTSPEFYPAGAIVPILVVAGVINAVRVYCNFGALYGKATRIIAEATWIKAAVSTIFLLLLIPIYGAIGAALALVISGVAEFFWSYTKSRKMYDMELDWKPFIYLFCMAALAEVVSLAIGSGTILQFAARVAITFLLMFVMYVMPIWEEEDKAIFKAWGRKAKGYLTRVLA